MTPDDAARMAKMVGGATLVIGGVLLAAPDRVGGLMDLDDDLGLRAIGVADLALVPGLIAGRRRWPWMAARAGLNLAIAAYLVRAGKAQGTWKPLPIAAALVGVTTVDGRAAAVLRVASR